MDKQTPREALDHLVEEIRKELFRYEEFDPCARDLAGVFMSQETFDKLKKADDNWLFDRVRYDCFVENYSLPSPIVSGLSCRPFIAHVMIDDKLPLGKVIVRHFKRG